MTKTPAIPVKTAVRDLASLRLRAVEKRDEDNGETLDFRTRVGAEKRARMRERVFAELDREMSSRQ